MDCTKTVDKMRLERTAKALCANNMDAYVVESREEARKIVEDLLYEGATISNGGTVTAQQCGLFDIFESGKYNFLDRSKASDATEVYRQSFFADFYFTSANAITENGELYNVDGNGNRVAAIVYGPKSIIVVAGMNKVEDDLDAAITRARTVAAPLNKQRFPNQTPCEVTGSCADCKAEGCICNQILVTRHCRPAGRIKFILVGEDLGL